MTSYIPLLTIKKTLDDLDHEAYICRKHYMRINKWDLVKDKYNKIRKGCFMYYFFLNFCLKNSIIDFPDDKIAFCMCYIRNATIEINNLHYKKNYF